MSFIYQTLMRNTVKRALLEGNMYCKHAKHWLRLAIGDWRLAILMQNHRTYVVNLQEVNIAWKTN